MYHNNRISISEKAGNPRQNVSKEFAGFTNLAANYSDFDRDCDHWKDNFALLADDSLHKSLVSRLSNHLCQNNENVHLSLWEGTLQSWHWHSILEI